MTIKTILRFSVVVILVLSTQWTASAAKKASLGKTTAGKATFLGRVSPGEATPSATADLGLEFRESPEEEENFDKQINGSVSSARVPAAHVPKPAATAVLGPVPTFGFDGLTHADQRLASGGNQFSSEPPDQGLAVGAGYVVEAVNTAIRVRSAADGSIALPAVGLNEFFGLAPAIIRDPVSFGPFVTDPKAYYDPATERFFVTVLVIDVDPPSGAFLPASRVLIAVSETSDPTGAYFIYALDTTNDTGTPDHPNCPCFGDQPLIGADANGFYVSTNEFPIFAPGFNGAQIYAISKADLISGSTATVVAFSGIPLAESIAYSVQPATAPPGGAQESANGGTEYFLSSLEFTGGLDNRIAVWALTNTSTLDGTPALSLQSAVVDSQLYGLPPDAEQKPGPQPLADLIFAGAFGRASREHPPLIASNDDRMQQTVFAGGYLWSALNTAVATKNGPVRTGIAYFIVEPQWTGDILGGSLHKGGYVSVNRNTVFYPSVGVNSSGEGVMAFTLVGPDYYPSAAYVPIDATNGAGDIRIAAVGAAPDDGFTGYGFFGGRAGRWGDYSSAVADQDGDIWFGVEYIPNAPRTALANWGTFIGKATP